LGTSAGKSSAQLWQDQKWRTAAAAAVSKLSHQSTLSHPTAAVAEGVDAAWGRLGLQLGVDRVESKNERANSWQFKCCSLFAG